MLESCGFCTVPPPPKGLDGGYLGSHCRSCPPLPWPPNGSCCQDTIWSRLVICPCPCPRLPPSLACLHSPLSAASLQAGLSSAPARLRACSRCPCCSAEGCSQGPGFPGEKGPLSSPSLTPWSTGQTCPPPCAALGPPCTPHTLASLQQEGSGSQLCDLSAWPQSRCSTAPSCSLPCSEPVGWPGDYGACGSCLWGSKPFHGQSLSRQVGQKLHWHRRSLPG